MLFICSIENNKIFTESLAYSIEIWLRPWLRKFIELSIYQNILKYVLANISYTVNWFALSLWRILHVVSHYYSLFFLIHHSFWSFFSPVLVKLAIKLPFFATKWTFFKVSESCWWPQTDTQVHTYIHIELHKSKYILVMLIFPFFPSRNYISKNWVQESACVCAFIDLTSSCEHRTCQRECSSEKKAVVMQSTMHTAPWTAIVQDIMKCNFFDPFFLFISYRNEQIHR